MREILQCPVCRKEHFTEVFANSYHGTAEQSSEFFLTDRKAAVHGRIVRCDSCGFLFTSPQFTEEQYDQIYRAVAAVEPPSGRSHAVAVRYKRLGALVREFLGDGRFLDFGCGDGQFLEYMPGFDGYGLDLRCTSVDNGQKRGERIIEMSLETAVNSGRLLPASFEFVTAWDVIEHLPKLSKDIATLKSLLKPGGWLFCTVPNVASLAARLSGERWNCYLLEHLWYFAPKTLAEFFQQQGFAKGNIRRFMFHADLATITDRIKQTYGIHIPLPRPMNDWTVPLPAGVIFGAFKLNS